MEGVEELAMANAMDDINHSQSRTKTMTFLPLLPVLLMVTSSLLLDYTLKKESTILQRTQSQIGLWLALAVSWMHVDFEAEHDTYAIVLAWSNLTVFCNLLVILAESLQRTYGEKTFLKQEAFSTAAEILQLVAISSWMVTIASSAMLCTEGWGENSMASSTGGLSLFGIFLVILISIRWHWKRQERIRKDTAQLPTTDAAAASETGLGRFCGPAFCAPKGSFPSMSTAQPVIVLDESQWYTWDGVQTMQWISRQFETSQASTHATGTVRNPEEEREEREFLISKLENQRITGDVLDELADVSKLIFLEIPFGPACRLSRAIAQLINQFPKPTTTDQHYPASRVSSESWLSKHDQEYNSTVEATEAEKCLGDKAVAYDSAVRNPVTVGQAPSIPKAEEDRLNQLMKDRFGLELPRIHNETNSSNSNLTKPTPPVRFAPDSFPLENGTEKENAQKSFSSVNSSALKPEQNNGPILDTLSDEMLQQMPPHIQDIAKRRPELVAQMIKQKRHQLQRQKSPIARPGYSTPAERTTRKRIQLSTHHENDDRFIPDNSSDGLDDCDDGDETTSLITRDFTDSPIHYRSVENVI